MIVIVGSLALNNRLGYEYRLPKDIDIWATWEDLQALQQDKNLKIYPKEQGLFVGMWYDQRVEIKIVSLTQPNTTLVIYNLHQTPNGTIYERPACFLDLDWLYLLKMSHRFKKNSPHFLKTMHDIHFLRSFGAKIPDQVLYKKRVEETLTKHPNLNQSKKDFFDTPGITYVYDHDDIHKAVAIGTRPAYTYYLRPGSEVFCDKKLFNATTEEIRLNGVLEEALVLALERSQIPFDYRVDKNKSFNTALTKVCTSITSGWFRTYAWENWFVIQARYQELDFDYVEKFKQCLQENKVRLHAK
jgi:hypothetical protein